MQGVEDLPGKGKKHVGLSLRVRRLHAGLTAASLEAGMGLTACVASIEDHGYILNLGIKVRSLEHAQLCSALRKTENAASIRLDAGTVLWQSDHSSFSSTVSF